MRILLTNDDGIDAPGLRALYLAVKDLGEVHVIAPTQVQSAMSHAVTFHRPIRVVEHDDGVVRGLSVGGRPADCVKLALAELVDGPIDLVLSGMNSGANVGINVIYSGTVAAAVEGSFHGIPSIAASLLIGKRDHDHWDRAAAHARDAIDQVLADGIEPGTAVNVNVPNLDGGAEPKGVRRAPVCMSATACRYGQTEDKDGRLYQIQKSVRGTEQDLRKEVQKDSLTGALATDVLCSPVMVWSQITLIRVDSAKGARSASHGSFSARISRISRWTDSSRMIRRCVPSASMTLSPSLSSSLEDNHLWLSTVA